MTAWFDWKDGSFGLILWGWWLHVKAPWAFAYFSERYGYERWNRVCGWRWQFRRVKRYGGK